MVSTHVRANPDNDRLCAGFERVREALDVPAAFPQDVLAEAQASAANGPSSSGSGTVRDCLDIGLVTIDPPGSRDLDQAFAAERHGDGYRIHYAIADVAAFVAPGGPIDEESRARGVTLYSPDMNTPLHPKELSEGAASLLPSVDRQALLWTIDLDASGEIVNANLERSLVRSRELLTYQQAQERIDAGHHDDLQLLREVGLLRERLERERGAVSLNLPSQEVVERNGQFELEYDESLPVERWNAQISLLTGIAAAQIMLDGGLGFLRTLPIPDGRTVAEIRRSALALDIDWPESMSYPDRVRDLDPNLAAHAALLSQAARGLRGAGYLAFEGTPDGHHEHSAIASVYAHVTAPLRRVCDRFANEIILAQCAGTSVPAWATEALEELPSIMGQARQKDSNLERAMVDYVEAALLQHRVGETFSAVVTNIRDDTARIQIKEPAVLASMARERHDLGDVVSVRLTAADPEARRVSFDAIG